jgi:hemerythrin superfamily protein
MAKKAAGTKRKASKPVAPRNTRRRSGSIAAAQPREASHKEPAPGASPAKAAKRAPEDLPASHAESATSPFQATAEAIGRTIGRTTAVIGQHLPWKGRNDGLTLLERDHRVLESLLKEAIDTDDRSDAKKKGLLARIAKQLTTHEMMEEKVLYPALKSHSETKDIVLEGYQEHHVADLVMKELQEMPPSDERWGAKLKVLKENIEHHIEEEEGEMFKSARSVLSEEQLEALGAQMQELRTKAMDRTPSD